MRIFGALILSAVMAGLAAGLIGLGVVGVFATLPIALVTALAIGFPAYLLLRRLGWLRPWQLAVAGAVITAPWGLLAPHEWRLWVFIGVTGAFAGLVFWWAGVSETTRGPSVGA